MANENTNPTTYADWAKTRDPDGSTAEIIELTSKFNPIIADAYVREANMTDGHQTTARANDPRGSWTGFNEGVMPVKSANRQVIDRAGYNTARIEVDKRLADLESDKAAFMMSEASSTMRGMALDHAETLFYGNSNLNPKRFMGLAPRYNSTSYESARNILNGQPGGGQSGTGGLTSMWLITWGPDTAFEFFPRVAGAQVGIKLNDLGEETVHDASGGRFRAYVHQLEQWIGFCLRDWRSCARIAQIEIADLNAEAVDLPVLMTKAVQRLRGGSGQRVFYCSETVLTAIDILAQKKSNAYFRPMEWAGMEITSFRGIPIRMCESILETEGYVTGLTANDGATI